MDKVTVLSVVAVVLGCFVGLLSWLWLTELRSRQYWREAYRQLLRERAHDAEWESRLMQRIRTLEGAQDDQDYIEDD